MLPLKAKLPKKNIFVAKNVKFKDCKKPKKPNTKIQNYKSPKKLN